MGPYNIQHETPSGYANRKVFRIRWPIGVLDGRWQAYGNLLLATLPCQARYRLHSSSPLISVPDVANRWLHIVCKKNKTGDNFGLCWGCVIGCLIPDLRRVHSQLNPSWSRVASEPYLPIDPWCYAVAPYYDTLQAFYCLSVVSQYGEQRTSPWTRLPMTMP